MARDGGLNPPRTLFLTDSQNLFIIFSGSHKDLAGMVCKARCAAGAFLGWKSAVGQSRSPPMMPSRASRLWNTLNKSRYRASVALM